VNIVMSAEHKAAGFELQYLGVAAGPATPEAIAVQSMPTGSLPAANAAPPQANAAGPGSTPPAKAKNQKPARKAPESWTSTLMKGW
jgi:hypothetical protein